MKSILMALVAIPTMLWAQPQAENHIPYIETAAKADSLVVPDEIFLRIHLREQDVRNKVSVDLSSTADRSSAYEPKQYLAVLVQPSKVVN